MNRYRVRSDGEGKRVGNVGPNAWCGPFSFTTATATRLLAATLLVMTGAVAAAPAAASPDPVVAPPLDRIVGSPLLAPAGEVPAPPGGGPMSAEELLAFGDNDLRMTVAVTITPGAGAAGAPVGGAITDGAGPYHFIVDTGAERTVISRELAALLGLTRGHDVHLTAMTGRATVATVVIPKINVGSIGGARIEAPALGARNLGAPGMLGIDTLQGHKLSIDFDRQRMTVGASTKRRSSEIAAPDEIVIHARSLYGELIVTEAFYRGRRIRVVLDTGAAISMGNLALRRLIVGHQTKLQIIGLISVTGDRLEAEYTTVDEVRVAGVRFANLPVAFADAAPFRRLGLIDQPALMLGMDSLRLFRRVDIDFANREVRLLLPRDAVRDS